MQKKNRVPTVPPGWKPSLKKFKTHNELKKPYTLEEVHWMIDNSNCGKAGGPEDGITAEVYKSLRNYIAPALLLLFNTVIKTENVPRNWRKGTITNIFKSGNRQIATNYRGIMLLDVAGKFFNGILAKRLTDYCEEHGILNKNQAAFVSLEGTHSPAGATTATLSHLQASAKPPKKREKGEGIYMLLIDLSKAFDCIGRREIYTALRYAGVPGKIIRIIKDLHTKTVVRYKVNGKHRSKPFGTIQEVPQGDPLSPICFNLVINPMLDEMDKAGKTIKLKTDKRERGRSVRSAKSASWAHNLSDVSRL